MGESTFDPPAAQPRPPRRRRRHPNGRWTNPASLLQAARFARKASGKQVVAEIRKLCPGHGQEKCKIDQSKLSDYENLRRKPSVVHIATFCRYYQVSPEALGLITWRDETATEPDATTGQNDGHDAPATDSDTPSSRDGHATIQEPLVMEWLRDSMVSITIALVKALANCPFELTEEELRRIIGDALPGGADTSGDVALDVDPPEVSAVASASGDPTTRPARPDPHHNGAAQPTAELHVNPTPEHARPEAAHVHGHDVSESTE